MMKITGLSHLFKWENLHNWWLTKYLFAPLYVGPVEAGRLHWKGLTPTNKTKELNEPMTSILFVPLNHCVRRHIQINLYTHFKVRSNSYCKIC